MFFLPTSKDKRDDFYTFEVDLDERSYIFQLYWNTRANGWFLSLLDLEGVPLVSGIRLTAGVAPLTWFVNTDNGILGRLYVHDTSGAHADPGRYDLAPDGRCVLIYFEQAEVEALFAATDVDATVKELWG